MARKKTKDVNYYTEETEQAFIQYMEPLNEEEAIKIHAYKPDGKHQMGQFKLSDMERAKIYDKYLKKPMSKLAELIVKKYGYQRKDIDFKDQHADAMGYLALIFCKFKPAEGKKSYSYFGTCIKHYAMNTKKNADKKSIRDLDLDDFFNDVVQRSDQIYEIDSPSFEPTKFIIEFIKEMKSELNKETLSDDEFKIGYSIISIFENRDKLFDFENDKKNSNNFNKNNILKMLRDMTLLDTKTIRKGLKRYKNVYNKFKLDHLDMDYEEHEDEDNMFIDSDYL